MQVDGRAWLRQWEPGPGYQLGGTLFPVSPPLDTGEGVYPLVNQAPCHGILMGRPQVGPYIS